MHPPRSMMSMSSYGQSQLLQQQPLYQQQQSHPAPFPPFSSPRPSYPPFTEHEYEEEVGYVRGRERYHAREMAVRTCYDLQRRQYNETPADPAQNLLKHHSVPADILRVEYVDFRPKENAKDHLTYNYDHVKDYEHPGPVYRRGQPFYISIATWERDFEPMKDCIYLNFYFGPNPSVPKRTRIVLPVGGQKEFTKAPQKWDVRFHSQDSRNLMLQVHIPATAQVGLWRCVVETATKHYQKSRLQYRAPEDMYVLFNPFCRVDAVYMEPDAQRNEYVTNDVGKVYVGAPRHVRGRPWVYGQYEDIVLSTACVLLNASGLSHAEWGNPVKVARALAMMIQASRYHGGRGEEGSEGLIESHYEGDYRGGQNPHLWTGSVRVIEEYLRRGASPVKYAHCWVMSALMTTFCRALGLPARPVSCFLAAHETQDTLTLDRYVDRFGDLLEGGPGRDQPDSLWTFHCWTDVWMARPDLSSGCSGWQALDPSRSYFKNKRTAISVGPCSVEAVRKGEVGYSYETSSFFASLNSYVRYYYENEDSEWGYSPFKQHRYPLSRAIVTKVVGRHDDDGDGDQEDITASYKDPERSDPERLTIFNACRGVRKDNVYHDYQQDHGTYDVVFELLEPPRVQAGQIMTATMQVHNNSNETRTIEANVSCRSIYYTGVLGPHLKRVTGKFTLTGGQRDTLALRLDPMEYQDRLVDMGFIKITASGHVHENKHSYIDEYDFTFEKPRLHIDVSECQVGQECKANFTFMNPLDVTLTECAFSFEMSSTVRPRASRINREVRPRESFTLSQTFVPRYSGEHRVVAAFTSRQLHDVTGSRRVTIRD